MHYVIYDDSVVIWCYHEEFIEKTRMGWKLYGIATTEELADIKAEECCYLDA